METYDPFSEKSVLESLVEQLNEDGILDEVDREHQASLEANPEWTRREFTHLHTIMEAWTCGVVSSDGWYKGYGLTENFQRVFNHVSLCLQEKFADEVVRISLVEVRQWLREWAEECPEFMAWNERGGSSVVSRYTEAPLRRQFIDLSVPSHNAALWIRDQRRLSRAFERRIAQRDTPSPGD